MQMQEKAIELRVGHMLALEACPHTMLKPWRMTNGC